MWLVKVPVPFPSAVLVDKATVGPELVLQHTPLTDMVVSLSVIILPPEMAEVVVTALKAVVVNTGSRLFIQRNA